MVVGRKKARGEGTPRGRREGKGGAGGRGRKGAGPIEAGLTAKQRRKVVSKAMISSSEDSDSDKGNKLKD